MKNTFTRSAPPAQPSVNRSGRGTTLVELLITLALASLLFSLLGSSVRDALTKLHLSKAQFADTKVRGRVLGILADLSEAASSAAFSKRLRLHDSGVLRLISGALLQLSAQTIPAENSNAITAVQYRLENTLIISQSKLGPIACGPTDAFTFEKSFIAASNNELCEVSISTAPSTSRCRAVTISPLEDSMFFPKCSGPLGFIQKVIPAEIFSFYLSRLGELRRLTHVGPEIIENQPTFTGISKVTFSLPTNYITAEYQLSRPNSRPNSLSLPLRLSSDDFLSYLFLR